jgi:Ca2+-dependent lipid-binding protein
MPDPYVCAYRNDEYVFCTSTKDDTFTATYNESFQADIYAADSWTFRAYDEDLASNDTIGGVIFDPISVGVIKAGGAVWDQGQYLQRLTFTIEPLQ